MSLDTSRFKLYAPFFKNLEISRSPGVPYRIEGHWRVFLLRPLGRALLPNLRRLSITTPCNVKGDQLDRITVFLSPSLVEISICKARWPIWVGLGCSDKLLRDIARNCPKLQTLCIFPGEPSGNPVPGRIVDDGYYT